MDRVYTLILESRNRIPASLPSYLSTYSNLCTLHKEQQFCPGQIKADEKGRLSLRHCYVSLEEGQSNLSVFIVPFVVSKNANCFFLWLLGFLFFFLKTGSHYITLAGLASASQALEPNFEIESRESKDLALLTSGLMLLLLSQN